MPDTAPSFVSLTSEATQLVLDVTKGEPPSFIYWGERLLAADPAELALLSRRQWAFGGPLVDLRRSLSMEMGLGLTSPLGLAAHRAGRDWALLFRTSDVAVDGQRVTIKAANGNSGVEITYSLVLDAFSDVLTVETALRNAKGAALTVNQAAVVAMPLDQRFDRLRTFTGRWAAEFQVQDIELAPGSYLRENRSGRTSHDLFPGLIAMSRQTGEHAGPCAGFHLGWSGNSHVRVDRHTDGRAYASLGELFLPGEMTLEEGEVYHTPPLYASFSADGLSQLSQNFHRHLHARILDKRTKTKPRPVHYNTWEAVYFDHNEAALKTLAERAAAVGAERFVLDDGWFGGRRSDAAGLGDWQVSQEVYPQGLELLAEHVRALGMEFGLWFEPEMVNADSNLFRAHPDWALGAEGVPDVPYRHQFTLDLTRAEVADFLFDAMDKLITDLRVAYIKWDMNRDTLHPGGSCGRARSHAQTHALYQLLKRLRAKHPALEIESCSSGGGRVDMGILQHTDRVWTSDNNDALERQSIQCGAAHFFPLSVLGSHVGPKTCHVTGRVLSMEFRAATAMFGHMGIEADLQQETAADLQILSAAIRLYKEHRGIIHTGAYHRLEVPGPFNAFSVVAQDQTASLISCAQLAAQRETLPLRLMLRGLDPNRRYRVRMIWPQTNPSRTAPSPIEHADLLGEGTVSSGAALMAHGLQLPLVHPLTCLIYHLEANGT